MIHSMLVCRLRIFLQSEEKFVTFILRLLLFCCIFLSQRREFLSDVSWRDVSIKQSNKRQTHVRGKSKVRWNLRNLKNLLLRQNATICRANAARNSIYTLCLHNHFTSPSSGLRLHNQFASTACFSNVETSLPIKRSKKCQTIKQFITRWINKLRWFYDVIFMGHTELLQLTAAFSWWLQLSLQNSFVWIN